MTTFFFFKVVTFIFLPFYAVFLSVFVLMFLFVSVSVTYVSVHLNLLASSILKCVWGWEVDWSDRQRQVANWNQSTISVVLIFIISFIIIRPWPLRLWRLINTVWMFFGDFNISQVSPLIVYRCWNNFLAVLESIISKLDNLIIWVWLNGPG